MKKLVYLLLVLLVSLAFSACKDLEDEDQMITVIDMVGDEVTLMENPKKVAVIARAAADMMIGFGLGDVVDGMYQSILDNPWVEVFYPNAANFHSYDYNESAELFLSRGVDLVLAPEKYIAEELRANGVTAITVSLYGTPTYESVIYKIADLIAQIWPRTEDKVSDWKEELDQAIDDITSVLDTKTITPRTIHYVRGDKDRGLGYTDTAGSLVETVYESYFGLIYLGKSFESNKPSIEEIMLQNPDIIVVGGAYQNKIINDASTTEPQSLLDAFANNQVFNIPLGFVMWEQNSIALPLFLYDQANKLYPEYFNFNIANKTQILFKEYFDVLLSDDDINRMLHGFFPIDSI
ncbi:MAG TPA: ABC transporter substrate-binding protein [Acholeplasmataceae bacterium]|nr:ABC transporter substrate-binding protein [Acholeplasmataceae bacterium]